MNDVISTFPIQDKIFIIHQLGSQGEFFRVPALHVTTKESDFIQEIIVTQKNGNSWIPQGNASISWKPEDDIIIVHQETPDLFSVVQEILQE